FVAVHAAAPLRPAPPVLAIHAGEEVTLLSGGNVEIQDSVRAQTVREGGEQPGRILDVLEHVDGVDDVERTADGKRAEITHAEREVRFRWSRSLVSEGDRHEAP